MRRMLLLLSCAALVSACEADGDDKGVIVLPGMHDSIPYDAYDPHPVLGQTLQHPPDGTVPYGATRYLYGPGPEEAKRAGEELTNPLAADEDALKRGRVAYDTFCLVCHGPTGLGDGPIIGRFPNPPSLLADRVKGLPDGQLFHVITYGSGIMAPYGVQVPADDRWRVIHYLRELQGPQDVQTAGEGGAQDDGADGTGGHGGGDDAAAGGAGTGGADAAPAAAPAPAAPAPVAPTPAPPPAAPPPATPAPAAPAPAPAAPAPAAPAPAPAAPAPQPPAPDITP